MRERSVPVEGHPYSRRLPSHDYRNCENEADWILRTLLRRGPMYRSALWSRLHNGTHSRLDFTGLCRLFEQMEAKALIGRIVKPSGAVLLSASKCQLCPGGFSFGPCGHGGGW